MMSAEKKTPGTIPPELAAKLGEHADDWDGLNRRLDMLAALTQEIYEALHKVEPARGKGEGEVVARQVSPASSLKARIGRAAKRMGLTFDEYVAKYGHVDAPSKAKKTAKKKTAKKSSKKTQRRGR